MTRREPRTRRHARTRFVTMSASKEGAPQSMTKLGALVQQLGPNKWLIAAGEQVPAFVFANGPAFVTHYNFKQPRGRKVDLKYLAINSHLPSRKSDMQDILTLTPAGVELSKRDPHAVVYEWEFACTGKSYYTTTAPNCTGLVVEAMAPAWRPAVVALTGTAAAASA